MNTIETLHARRSIRAYKPLAVPRAVIEEIVWAAVQAPTPPVSGDQAWAIVVIEGQARLHDYGQRAKQYAHDHPPIGTPRDWTTRPGFQVFWGAPALVLICARKNNPEAVFDCCRAGQNLLLAAHSMGLGTCWVGAPIPWLLDPNTQAELALPQDFSPAVAITLGYPDETPAGLPRARPVIQWV